MNPMYIGKVRYNVRQDWSKKRRVCNSNAIRTDKANEYVFGKLAELLSNDKMVKAIVSNINKERKGKVEPSKKELARVDKELKKLDTKKKKIFELYEEEIITKEEFFNRKEELNYRINELLQEKQPLLVAISGDTQEQIPCEFVKEILQNFSKLLSNCETREQ